MTADSKPHSSAMDIIRRDGVDALEAEFSRLRGLEEQLETLQRDYNLAVGWLDQYEGWASRMPDAGLTDDDPRRSWYLRRPHFPDFPNWEWAVSTPASIPETVSPKSHPTGTEWPKLR